jgi:Flp pilus assembly protein TadD
MRPHRPFVPFLVALFVLSAGFQGDAQDWKGLGRLEGRVTDPNGKPIAGATIKLRVPGRPNDGPDVKTNASGRWSVMGLRGGDWKITIEAPGYITGETVFSVSEVMRANPLAYTMAPVPVAAPEPEKTGLPPEVVEALKTGNEALEQKKWAEARAAFEKVLPVAPDNSGLLIALARSYSGEGNSEKAVEMLKRITDKDPANWGVWMLMANMLLESGKLDEGRAALEKVPQGSVTDPIVFINVGVLFMNKAKMDEAEGWFAKAVDLAPAQFDGYYYRGLARIALHKRDGARADFRKVIELAPPDAGEVKDAKQYLEALK